jgi:hypothetical protein
MDSFFNGRYFWFFWPSLLYFEVMRRLDRLLGQPELPCRMRSACGTTHGSQGISEHARSSGGRRPHWTLSPLTIADIGFQ